VRLQTLFRKTGAIVYFIVSCIAPSRLPYLDINQIDESESDAQATRQLLQETYNSNLDIDGAATAAAAAKQLKREYEMAQKAHLQRYAVVEGRQHISELTAWLRSTKYQAYLEDIETARLSASYALP
jgi:hypothetical protein